MWGRASLLIGVIKISTINCQSSEPLGMSNHVYIRKSLIVSICWCRTRRIMDGLSPELRTRMPWQMNRFLTALLELGGWMLRSIQSIPSGHDLYLHSFLDRCSRYLLGNYNHYSVTILSPGGICLWQFFPIRTLIYLAVLLKSGLVGPVRVAQRRGEKGETATYCPLYSLLTHRLLFSSCRGFIWQ